jgi:CheY-like chemotaxis protein
MLESIPDRKRIFVFDERQNRRKTPRTPAQKDKQRSHDSAVRVLLFSRIWEVALYRAEALRAHGLDVVTPRCKEEAEEIIRRGEVDVVVLAYTLPSETVRELSDFIRQDCPGCRLIAISESGQFDQQVSPDAIVIASQGPGALIDAIRRVSRLQ